MREESHKADPSKLLAIVIEIILVEELDYRKLEVVFLELFFNEGKHG